MGKPPDETTKLSDTLSLSEYKDPKNGSFGFWLWDETVGMNLAMQARTREEAVLQALVYHQKARKRALEQRNELQAAIDGFLGSLRDIDPDQFNLCTNCRRDD